MKDSVLTLCDKNFVLEAISKTRRLDGREFDDARNIQIHFGKDFGCCQVSLGETKVLAQVSCEVGQPSATRPNEGLLYVNVEFSPMGSPHFEIGRQSELSIIINRVLEKCIKDSRCLDLEALCIVSAEKVWSIRIDINILNHEGNLTDAASVAALAALSHFRRPDVTTTGDQVIIHDLSEKDPVPLSLHHYPVCVTFAIFNSGVNVLVDPTAVEEKVADGHLVLGLNAYRELCAVHLGALIDPQVTITCANRAAKRAAIVINEIKAALLRDGEKRNEGKPVGFVESLKQNIYVAPEHERWSVALTSCGLHNVKKLKKQTEVEVMDLDKSFEDGTTTPIQRLKVDNVMDDSLVKAPSDLSEESEASDIEVVAEITPDERWKAVEQIVLSDGSEEENTVTLQPQGVCQLPKRSSKKKPR